MNRRLMRRVFERNMGTMDYEAVNRFLFSRSEAAPPPPPPLS